MSAIPGMNDKAVVRGVELRLDTAFDGVTNHFPTTIQDLTVNGKKLDRVSLQREIESTRGPWKDARQAHATLRQFTRDEAARERAAAELLSGLEAALVAHFGRESEELTKFGFKPFKRRRAATVEEKALRAAKAKLTREKRGTLGKKQRAAIKAEGTPSVAITPDGAMHVAPPSSGVPVPPPPPAIPAPQPQPQP